MTIVNPKFKHLVQPAKIAFAEPFNFMVDPLWQGIRKR
jgi:hypothetical protein